MTNLDPCPHCINDIDFHDVGLDTCSECYSEEKATHKDCGGGWHNRLVDDIEDAGWIYNYRCDKCLTKDYHVGYEEYEIGFKE